MRDDREYLYFDGKASTDYGLYITDAGVYTSPARNYDKVQVPGRNGDLLFENDRFDNIEVVYPAILVEDFDHNFDAWKAFCLSRRGYLRLADSYHPDEFYLASFNRFEDIKTKIHAKGGTFKMVFDRKPQKFLKEGEVTREITSFPADILNPTQFKAYPLIRLYGSGTLTIGDISITLTTSSQYVDIDCELAEALVAAENLNITTTGGRFPYLEPGLNEISWTGSRLEITPRFYSI